MRFEERGSQQKQQQRHHKLQQQQHHKPQPQHQDPQQQQQKPQLVEVLVSHYGLNGAAQRWWCSVKGCVTSGGRQGIFDGCVYYVYESKAGAAGGEAREILCGVPGHHVDDFVGGGRGAA